MPLPGYCFIYILWWCVLQTDTIILRRIFIIACSNLLFCRWYYDSSEGVCHEFSYGGKKGNGNRFLTRQDCEASCQPGQVRLSKLLRGKIK